MATPITCTCGAVLLQGISDRGVTPVGSDLEIPFRRTTDYVVCGECFQSFGVQELIDSLRARNEDVAVIEQLERLADEEPGER